MPDVLFAQSISLGWCSIPRCSTAYDRLREQRKTRTCSHMLYVLSTDIALYFTHEQSAFRLGDLIGKYQCTHDRYIARPLSLHSSASAVAGRSFSTGKLSCSAVLWYNMATAVRSIFVSITWVPPTAGKNSSTQKNRKSNARINTCIRFCSV